MKKIIAVVFSIALIMGMFTACNDSKESSSSTADDTFRVALLIPGLLGDKSFFDGANDSIPLINAEIEAETKVVEMGLDQTKWYPTFIDFCEGDYDLILTISDAIADVLHEVAEEYPEQMFINLDSQAPSVPANVYALSTKSNEMSFLAGVVGALKAEELGENVIGFIGGLDIAGINEFLVGYIDGAQYVNSDIKVATSYIGSFTDTAKGKENAIIMYNSGVSIIYAAAGQSGLGVIDAAKDLGTYAIGVDSDQAMALKDSDVAKAERILTSAVKKTPQYTLQAVKDHIAGNIPYGQKDLIGLKEGGVGIAKNEFYDNNLSDEIRARVEEVEGMVASGEVEIIKTAGMSADELNVIRDSVRP